LTSVSVNFCRNVVVFCVTKYNSNVRLILVGARARACDTGAVNTGQISNSHIPREACKRAVVLLAVVSPLLDLLHGMIQGSHLPRQSVVLPGST